MIKFEKLTIDAIEMLADYLMLNRNNIENVIADFGEIKMENGFGTYFLTPTDPFFATFYVHQDNSKVKSIGFGSVNLGITLQDIYEAYPVYRSGFVPYDDAYHCYFHKIKNATHSISMIFRDEPIIRDGRIVPNINVNGLTISLYPLD